MTETTDPRQTDERPKPGATPGAVPGRQDRVTDLADLAEEPLGGDPPCWAHLFEEDEAEPPR